MSSFARRIIGASTFDVEIYEEVEADRSALGQAAVVVVLSSVAAGMGKSGGDLQDSLLVTFAALLVWLFWAWITYIIGVRILPAQQTRSDLPELLRTTGFSSAPGMLRVLGAVPGLTGVIFLATSLWMLATFVLAVRQALDYESIWRAVGVYLAGWLVYAALFLVLDHFTLS